MKLQGIANRLATELAMLDRLEIDDVDLREGVHLAACHVQYAIDIMHQSLAALTGDTQGRSDLSH